MGWSTVNNIPASIDTMLLLTDDSVMAHVLASPKWYRLIPEIYLQLIINIARLLLPSLGRPTLPRLMGRRADNIIQ
jgi:hypothetical protein